MPPMADENEALGMAAPPKARTTEICVPLASLAIDAEGPPGGAGDQAGAPGVVPELGDEVTATVTGKVTRIEGDNAYVAVPSGDGNASPADEGDALQAMYQGNENQEAL